MVCPTLEALRRYWRTFAQLAGRARFRRSRCQLALSFATVGELYYTARRAKSPTRTIAYWKERLRHYAELFPDLETCEVWAHITAECMGRGRPRQDNDLWIAATALRYGLALVTHNRRDFEDIPGLTLVSEAPYTGA